MKEIKLYFSIIDLKYFPLIYMNSKTVSFCDQISNHIVGRVLESRNSSYVMFRLTLKTQVP